MKCLRFPIQRIVTGFLLCVLSGPAFVQTPAIDFSVPSVRSTSLGGYHAALADDFEALFSNPAGFVSAEPGISIARIGIGVGGPVFTMAGLVLSGVASDGGAAALLASESMQDILASLYMETTVSGPLQFGYVGNGLGFGIFNTSRIFMESSGTTLELQAVLREQLLLNGGYAIRVPFPAHWGIVMDAGLLMKAFINTDVVMRQTLFGLMSLVDSPDSIAGNAMSSPLQLVSGIGFDAGVLVDFYKIASLGIMGRDIYTPTVRSDYTGLQSYLDGEDPVSTEHGLVPFDLSAGVLVNIPLGFLKQIINSMKFMIDYKNILDFVVMPGNTSNPILHVGAGFEITLIDILDVRIGMNQGLFAAGFGLDLTWFVFQVSMYGRELSHEPGMRPVFNMMFSLDFRY